MPSGTTGRPAKPIETDPNRYLYAEIQSLISYHKATGTGASANRVAENVIAGHYGTPVTTETIIGFDGMPVLREDNIKAMAEGRPFMVYAFPKRGGILKKAVGFNATQWRNKNIFRPAADDMLHKLRVLRTDPWLMIMDDLVNTCWQGTSEDPETVERLRKTADSIGERHIFESKLLPLLRKHAELRKAGYHAVQLVPGFLSGSFRAKRLEKTEKQ